MNAPRTAWGGVTIAFLAGVAAATALAKASPAAPALQATLGLSLAQVGWVMALGTLATAVLGVASGSLSTRYGPRALAIAGAGVLVAAGAAGALSPAAPALLGARAVEGLGVILITVAAPALIAAQTRPADLGMAMGVWALWMPAGSLVVLLLAPSLVAVGSWRVLWALSALAALAVLPALARLPAPVRGGPRPPAMAVLGQAGPWLLAVVFACFSLQFFSVFTFLPTLLAAHAGFDAAGAARAAALVPAAIIPGNLLGGWLVQRGAAPWRVMVLPALALMVLGPAVLAAPLPAAGMLTVLAVYGLVLGIVPTAIFVQAPRLAGPGGGAPAVLGLAMSGQGVGILCGPPLAGALLERTGPPGAAGLVAAALAVLIAAALGLRAVTAQGG